jgi:large subunit ribosomal protein L3
MTALWDVKGNRLPVTILQISRAQVVSVKTLPKHGYWAVQVGIGLRNPRNVTKAMLGHFAAAGVAPKTKVGEFRVRDESGLLPVGILTLCYCRMTSRVRDQCHAFSGRPVC